MLSQLWSDWFNGTNYGDLFRKTALKNILNVASQTSFYKSMIEQKKMPQNPRLNDFPLITKKKIRENASGFRQSNVFLPRVLKNTGGSTGQPFEFYASPEARNFEIAHQLFFYKRVGFESRDRIYSFGGYRVSDDMIKKKIYWTKNFFRPFPYGSVRFSALNLSNATADIYIQKIIDDKPQFLRGYSSAISLLAEIIIEKGLQKKINFLKGVMMTSETIDDYQMNITSQAYNCPILPQYGMSEVSAFGFTKPNEMSYYCSPFYGWTEVLDGNGKHVKIGETGEIVLTSFGNFFQPFIRYRTGDLAEYGGQDRGFVILNRIFGRTQDYIVGKDNKRIMLVGLIHGGHFAAFKAIKCWQIRQDKPGKILLKIQPDRNWNDICEKEILNKLNFNGKVDVELRYCEDFELTKAGKRKFVIQTVK